MNVFGGASHKWRKNRKRGVSPIIATILLVAITVVLAAVLYVLVSGLTRTSTSTPYQLGIAETGGATNYVYLSLAPTSGLTTSAFGLTIVSPSSVTQATVASPAGCKANIAWATTTCTTTAGGWYGVLVMSNGTIAATYGGASAAWTYATGTSTIAVTGAYSLNVVSASTYYGSQDVISAFGTGSSSVSGSATL